VYSGTITAGLDMVNQSNGKSERLAQLYIMSGKDRKEAGKLLAGDIGAVVKLKDTHTNNTLSDKNLPVVYRTIQFPDPVFHAAVHPRSKGDEDKLSTALHAEHRKIQPFSFG
jgi:elongation factor G